MKKFSLVAIILLLILSTAIIKNTTKQIEDELFTAKENIRVLKSEFENISLEHDYLSSAEKLLEYQSLYFEDELIQKDIKDIKIYNISKEKKSKISKLLKSNGSK
jgi:predicted membrane protein